MYVYLYLYIYTHIYMYNIYYIYMLKDKLFLSLVVFKICHFWLYLVCIRKARRKEHFKIFISIPTYWPSECILLIFNSYVVNLN